MMSSSAACLARQGREGQPSQTSVAVADNDGLRSNFLSNRGDSASMGAAGSARMQPPTIVACDNREGRRSTARIREGAGAAYARVWCLRLEKLLGTVSTWSAVSGSPDDGQRGKVQPVNRSDRFCDAIPDDDVPDQAAGPAEVLHRTLRGNFVEMSSVG
jgi:hypothetical protein